MLMSLQDLYAIFGGEKRFHARIRQIKLELEQLCRWGVSALEVVDRYYDDHLAELLRVFNGDVEKLRQHVLRVKQWARSRAS